ncbi:hypothetical protein AVEN_260926-1, partial [Araneus ventricosus]
MTMKMKTTKQIEKVTWKQADERFADFYKICQEMSIYVSHDVVKLNCNNKFLKLRCESCKQRDIRNYVITLRNASHLHDNMCANELRILEFLQMASEKLR